MGKYFGREPRYSQQEAEAQAKQAIEAAVSKGRPPDEDWKPLAPRMAEINQELATRRPVDLDQAPAPRRAEPGNADRPGRRRPVNEILRPRPVPAEQEPRASAAPPPKRATRAPAGADTAAPASAKRASSASPAERAARASSPPPPAKPPTAKRKRPE